MKEKKNERIKIILEFLGRICPEIQKVLNDNHPYCLIYYFLQKFKYQSIINIKQKWDKGFLLKEN